MMTPRPSTRVYFASKIENFAEVLKIREEWPQIYFTARWPFLIAADVPDHKDWAPHFWQDDYDDIWRSDVVLIWAKPEQRLRGALVEAGIGMALGKVILLAGDHPDFGTWQHHPICRREASLEIALAWARDFLPERHFGRRDRVR